MLYSSCVQIKLPRVQVDENMMAELQAIKGEIAPTDTLLVVDAMTGQEAAQLTKAFNDAVELTGAQARTHGFSWCWVGHTLLQCAPKPAPAHMLPRCLLWKGMRVGSRRS